MEGLACMNTEQEYVEALPFLGTWLAGRRAKFVEGMARLQAEPIPVADVGDVIGVIVIDDDELEACYMPRERVLRKVISEGMPAEALAVMAAGARAGQMLALVITPEGRALIEIPVHLMIIQTQRGAAAN
jgi:hypothetical protein